MDKEAPLGREVAKGATWLIALNVGGLVRLVIFSRLLAPTDFGIAALGGSIGRQANCRWSDPVSRGFRSAYRTRVACADYKPCDTFGRFCVVVGECLCLP
jgi:hypothetical protein